jgi:hypothetical protein
MTEQEITNALSRLRKITHDSSGWNTLYRNDASGELWEVTHPRSEMHGGGPRELRRASSENATATYGITDYDA